MALWPFSLQAKAAPARVSADAPKQPGVVYLNDGTTAAIVSWSNTVAAEQAMLHPITFRALDKLASSVQQVRWYVGPDPMAPKSEQEGKAGIMKGIQALLDSPNDDMTPAMLRYWMTLNYAAYGRVPLKVTFSAVDRAMPNGLYPLEVKYVQAALGQRGTVESYEYGTGETKQIMVSRSKWTPATKGGFVDQIWKPSFKGYQHRDERNTPLQSLGLPSQVIRALMVRAIRSAEGHPNCRYLVTCSKTLTAKQLEALKAHLNEDHGTAGADSGRVPVLQNAGEVVIHKLDNDLSDIHTKLPSDDMARLIFGAFGVPIALAGIGAADGAKFSGNFVESRQSFWEDTIIPVYIQPLFQGLTRMLCPPGLRIIPDLDSIPALVAGRAYAMASISNVAFLTQTEKRELFGWDPVTQQQVDKEITLAPVASVPKVPE